MKLRHSPTSPFVRKVMWCAHELGIADRIETVATDAWSEPAELTELNPLSKVPTLLTDDVGPLYDSPVICEYLDALAGGDRLIPATGPERWTVKREEALADGIMDAAVLVFLELNKRPAEAQSGYWLDLQRNAIGRALSSLAATRVQPGTEIDLGDVAIGTALAYLDLRGAVGEWRTTYPALADWFATISARDGFQLTRPPA